MNLEDKEKRYIQSDNDNRADSQADRANRSDITDIAARDNSSGEMEIDLRALLYMLWSRLWLIISLGIMGACLAAVISQNILIPQYSASTQIYILNKQDQSTVTYNDLQSGAQLTKDYMQLIKSRTVLKQAIADLNLQMTPEQLASKIDVSAVSDTRIITITLTDADPYRAAEMANRVREISSKQIQEVMDIEAVSLVDAADIPSKPTSPDFRKNILLGGLAVSAVTIFCLILLFLLNDKIKTSEDVGEKLALNVLGSIPQFNRKNRKYKKPKTRQQEEAKKHENNIIPGKIKDDIPVSEAYNTLRSNIQFCGSHIKVISVTSCLSGEGKSCVSMQMAFSMSDIGKKVLYIDADLRKPASSKQISIDRAIPGLTQYLSGMCETEEVLLNTNRKNLDMIHSGPVPANPSELLENGRLKELLDEVKTQYDYIFIDTPPLVPVIDSAIISNICDRIIMVIEFNRISCRLASSVTKQLNKTNCRILGVILNKIDINKKSSYEKYYDSTYYREYYGRH